MSPARIIDQNMLDAASEAARGSPRGRRNVNFHQADEAQCHRLLNAIEPGSYVAPHRHLDPAKDETIIVLRGRLGCVFFADDGTIVETCVLEPGGGVVGVDIPHRTFHTIFALEPGTVFFEAKAGPYLPLADAECAPWAPREGETGCAEFRAVIEQAVCGKRRAEGQ